jgi:gamma-glutamyltranspeptidase/glutathione hydrolase
VHGPLTVTVPGAAEAWFTLLARFGTRTFGELATTAISYARDGFPLSTRAAGYLKGSAKLYSADWAQSWRSIYAGAQPGGLLRQPALAHTIELLSTEGPDAYYRGPIGKAIAGTLQSHGAFMSADDLASHTGDWVEPLSTAYRGVDVFELPPNTQGVALLEALNIIEDVDLGDPESGHRHHVLLEGMKLALSDRSAHVTDPEHMRIDPAELVSKEWAKARRADLDPSRASSPVTARAAVGGTIYLCAADEAGMLVSLIQSNYAGFGSGVTVPEWGINLQNRGSYFSLDPDHVNVIAPRKRTMHTLMPAMAFRDGAPWLVFGTMGGDGQAQTQLQFLTRVVDDGADVQQAIDAPRWRVSHVDWSVQTESRFDGTVVAGLRNRGHEVVPAGTYDGGMGHAHAIEVTEHGYAAATDPRAEGAALGL